jgi:hypothetical protein
MERSLVLPERKAIRAQVVASYVGAAGLRGVVCFSCGNASAALRDAGLRVVDVSPRGDLVAGRWWLPEEIAAAWPHLFDATSGHLPMPLMARLATAFRAAIGPLDGGRYDVPTGSGETITCLRMAYGATEFRAVYDDHEPATRYDEEAPLSGVVRAMGPVARRGPAPPAADRGGPARLSAA